MVNWNICFIFKNFLNKHYFYLCYLCISFYLKTSIFKFTPNLWILCFGSFPVRWCLILVSDSNTRIRTHANLIDHYISHPVVNFDAHREELQRQGIDMTLNTPSFWHYVVVRKYRCVFRNRIPFCIDYYEQDQKCFTFLICQPSCFLISL